MERNQCPYCNHVPALSYGCRVCPPRKPMSCQACGGPLTFSYSSKKDRLIFVLAVLLIFGPPLAFELWARITHTPSAFTDEGLTGYMTIMWLVVTYGLPIVAGRVVPWRDWHLSSRQPQQAV